MAPANPRPGIIRADHLTAPDVQSSEYFSSAWEGGRLDATLRTGEGHVVILTVNSLPRWVERSKGC